MKIKPFDRGLLGILAAAAVLYGILSMRRYVGQFNDDALYVIAAKSLLSGRFLTLLLPEQPPLNHFLPGFPLALSPFVALLQPHWEGLKFTSMAWTLMSGIALWVLSRRFFSPGLSRLILGLTLFNPAVAVYSSVMMPEPFFVLAITLVWIVLDRVLRAQTSGRLAVLAGVLAWACLIRHEAILLAGCVAVGLWFANRRGLIIGAVGPAVLAWGIFMLRNLALTRSYTDYLPYLQPVNGSLHSLFGSLPTKALAWLDVLCVQSLAGLAWSPTSALRAFVAAMIMGMGLALAVAGVIRLWKTQTTLRPILLGMGCWVVAYDLIHLCWYVVDVRYSLPIMPFLWIFIVAGVKDLWINFRAWRALVVGLGLILVYGYVDQNSYAAYRSLTHSDPASRQLPRETLAWISENIPIGQRLMSNKIETVYLYTGRQGYFLLFARDPQDFIEQLSAHQVSTIVYREQAGLDPALKARWNQTMDWVTQDKRRFTPIYLNPAEQSVIFKVDLQSGKDHPTAK